MGGQAEEFWALLPRSWRVWLWPRSCVILAPTQRAWQYRERARLPGWRSESKLRYKGPCVLSFHLKTGWKAHALLSMEMMALMASCPKSYQPSVLAVALSPLLRKEN